MRKLFALTLAVAMVLSLASVAFAKDSDLKSDMEAVSNSISTPIHSIDGVSYKYNSDIDSGKGGMLFQNAPAYGDTIFYALLDQAGSVVAASDSVKSLKPKLKWDMNGDMVTKVEIVKKKYRNDGGTVAQNYGYFIAVTFKDHNSTSKTDIAGKITLKKTSPTEWAITGVDKTDKNTAVLDFGITVGFSAPTKDLNTVPNGNKTFNFSDLGLQNEDQDLEFADWDGARFTCDLTGQGKLVLKMDNKYNATVAAKYPQANLDFFNGNGASFNKIGELLITAKEGSYLYAQNEDGTLSKVNATYDEYEEGFLLKTRTLGKYVISDMELDIAATAPGVDVVPGTPSVTPPSVVTPTNPGTGAAA